MSSLLFLFALVLMFGVIAPLLWASPILLYRLIERSPALAQSLGFEVNPIAIRVVLALIIGAISFAFAPGLARFALFAGIITLIGAIPFILIKAVGQGLLAGRDAFWDAFWDRAKAVPWLCGLFVVLLSVQMLLWAHARNLRAH